MARYVCAERGISLIDYLSDIIRSKVTRDFQEAGKRIQGG